MAAKDEFIGPGAVYDESAEAAPIWQRNAASQILWPKPAMPQQSSLRRHCSASRGN